MASKLCRRWSTIYYYFNSDINYATLLADPQESQVTKFNAGNAGLILAGRKNEFEQ